MEKLPHKSINNASTNVQKSYKKKDTPKTKTPKPNQKGPQGYQNTADKGGKGRDPGWNPPLKEKIAAKPNLLRERVHAGRKHADCDPMPTRPCGGPQTGPGRIFR